MDKAPDGGPTKSAAADAAAAVSASPDAEPRTYHIITQF
jgi:hypothetical protein